jgi:hypothetical protein
LHGAGVLTNAAECEGPCHQDEYWSGHGAPHGAGCRNPQAPFAFSVSAQQLLPRNLSSRLRGQVRPCSLEIRQRRS